MSDLTSLSNDDLLKMYQPQAVAPSGGLSGMSNEQLMALYQPQQGVTPAAPQSPARNYALSEVPGAAVANVGKDAGEVVQGLGETIKHPLNTAASLAGLVIPEFISKGQQYVSHKIADQLPEGMAKRWIGELADMQANAPTAVRQHLMERYGGWENLKRSMAEHPLQTAMDVSTILSGGEAALASSMPKTANALGAVARGTSLPIPAGVPVVGGRSIPIPGIDPMVNAQRAAGGVADLVGGAAKYPVSVASGLTPSAQGKIAADARAGGTTAQAALRGAETADPVVMARNALSKVAEERQAQYLANKAEWGSDAQTLTHRPILEALEDAQKKVMSSQGGFIKDPAALQTLKEIGSTVIEHMKSGETFNPVSMDALKQRLGVILENKDLTTLSRNVAKQVYDATKNEISAKAPNYAKAMDQYSAASAQLNDLTRSLSLNPNASRGTTLAKLQTMMRNDVSANYGHRAKLGEVLAKHESDLLPTLAGQMGHSWVGRGLTARMLQGLEGVGAAGAAVAAPHLLPVVAGGLAASSPRIVGEAINAANRVRDPMAAYGYAGTRANVGGLLAPRDEQRRRGLLSP